MGSDPLEIKNLLLGVRQKLEDLPDFDRIDLAADGRSLTAATHAAEGYTFFIIDDAQPGRLRIGLRGITARIPPTLFRDTHAFEDHLAKALDTHGYHGRLPITLDPQPDALEAWSHLTPAAGGNLAAQAMVDRAADVLLGYRACLADLLA